MSAPDSELKKDLFPNETDDFGKDDVQTLLEEYKAFVDTIEKATSRRQIANSFFLTVNSILITASGWMVKEAFDETIALVAVLTFAVAGVLFCLIWRRIIQNYRQLNAAKFDVIHGLEQALPAAPFQAEWTALGKGKDRKKYIPISKMEAGVAVVFIILYSIAFLASVGFLTLAAQASVT
ncbi:hypothetical protein ACFL4G_08085 [Thermodesulfobacteriota bacterium]